jgi:hypothetical protein
LRRLADWYREVGQCLQMSLGNVVGFVTRLLDDHGHSGMHGPPPCRKRKVGVTGRSAQMYTAFDGVDYSWPGWNALRSPRSNSRLEQDCSKEQIGAVPRNLLMIENDVRQRSI